MTGLTFDDVVRVVHHQRAGNDRGTGKPLVVNPASQVAKRAVVLAGVGQPTEATITTSGRVEVGSTVTTLGGTYAVVEVDHGAPAPANRHQRRAAAAKRRKGDAR